MTVWKPGSWTAAEEGVDQNVCMSHHKVRSQAFKLMSFIMSVPFCGNSIENNRFSLGGLLCMEVAGCSPAVQSGTLRGAVDGYGHPCSIRREAGHSLVILEGNKGFPL